MDICHKEVLSIILDELLDLGYEIAHVGINMPDADAALALANSLNHAFGFNVKVGNSSIFASPEIEVNKYMGRGVHGHLAVRTHDMAQAIADLEAKGYTVWAEYDGHVILKSPPIN